MIIIDCQQNTTEWHTARLGKATASKFDKIITPGGEKSKQWEAYAHEILAEEMVGHAIDGYQSFDMTEGTRREEESVSYYELTKGVDTQRVGFITNNAGTLGCSPDRLIGADGMLELKNPKHGTQAGYLLSDGKISKEYWPQLQGQLYIAERQWVDIMSYFPEMPELIIPVGRDEAYIKLMDEMLQEFIVKLGKKRSLAIEKGYLKVPATKAMA